MVPEHGISAGHVIIISYLFAGCEFSNSLGPEMDNLRCMPHYTTGDAALFTGSRGMFVYAAFEFPLTNHVVCKFFPPVHRSNCLLSLESHFVRQTSRWKSRQANGSITPRDTRDTLTQRTFAQQALFSWLRIDRHCGSNP